MTETTTSKVEKWSYPFKIEGAEATDPQQYYKALAKANDGYYPLGSNGLWHGGVHFDESTGLVAQQSEVRCIADGQVIAYRIDEAYPVSAYSDRSTIASTGFVLVKHQLEVPAPPTPATAAGATPAPAAAGGPTLVFYSLYMHLLDMAGYNATPALERPAYWGGDTYQVSASANDKVLGLNVHAAQKNTQGYEQILATLPQGTTVTTGEASANGQWLKIVSVSPEMSGLAADTGWIYKGNMSSLGNNQYLIGKKADDVPANQAKGLNVHQTAATSGAILSVLPTGTQVKISEEGASGQYRKLVEIISGEPVPALTADASGSLPGFVWLPSLETRREPKAMGSVVVLDTPVTIKAGALVGHAGQYQNHDEGSPRNLVHLEVFSCDDVEAFVTQSRSKANALPANQKNLMKVYKNTKLITHRADISSTNPPKVSDDGTMTGYDLIIPVSVLEAMPADKKIKVPAATQGGDTLWWHLEGLLGDAQGNPISGWLAEQDLMTTRHNPWEWEGFEFIEETVSNADHLAANFHDRNLLDDSEKATFLPKVSTSTRGPAKERLYNLIDTDKDDKLTANEIRAALAKPWFAQSISQLVTKYESEWYYKAEKWDALDELMGHTAAQPNVSWVAEKKRIEKLAWWGDLAGKEGIGEGGKIWHFHPVGMLSNSKCQGGFINVDKFISEYVAVHMSFDGANVALSDVSKVNIKRIIENINKYVDSTKEIVTVYELSYMFATARVEAYNFLAHEYFSAAPEIGGVDYFNKYDPVLASTQTLRNRAISHGNITQGDGYKYRGRGLVHLTWKSNYQKAKDKFGFDFVSSPELAADYDKAVPIMIWGMLEGVFSGRKLGTYVNNDSKDYEGARNVINGSDRKELIASHAVRFEEVLKKSSIAPEVR
ncbi:MULTISPECIES: hypothetical protein [Pseudomonas]|uniref:hypothetical protein n=1 Tax=Pseudomonas TaxID=286 RepID=UPI000CD4B865|nr:MULTISPECIES: hypothetical protein [Pseudomonas]RBH52921.1 hypothetical protein C3F00_029830 [Pseudomonas sp. MWU13-2860]